MPFEKGQGGRPKGAQNKLTKTVRQVVLDTFNKLQETKQHNLEAFAKENPVEFYRIAAKLIPTEVTGGLKLTGFKITYGKRRDNTD